MISGLQLKKTSVSLQEVQDLKDKIEAVKLPRDRSVLLTVIVCLLAVVYADCWLIFCDKFLIEWLIDNFTTWSGGVCFVLVISVNVALLFVFSFLWFMSVVPKINHPYLSNKKLKEDLLHRVSALQDLITLQENILLVLSRAENQHAYLSADYVYFTDKVNSVYVITEEFALPEGVVTTDEPGVLNVSIADDEYCAVQECFADWQLAKEKK